MIFTVPGKPGLYKLVSQGRTEGEISLPNVFRNIHKKENGGKCLDHNAKSPELRAYFAEVLPDYDQERVYDSNIRKVLQWYNILADNNLVDQELSEREKRQMEALAEHEAEEAKEAEDSSKAE